MFQNFRPWSYAEVTVITLLGVFAAYNCGGI